MYRREDRITELTLHKARSAERTGTIFFVTVTLSALVIAFLILSLT